MELDFARYSFPSFSSSRMSLTFSTRDGSNCYRKKHVSPVCNLLQESKTTEATRRNLNFCQIFATALDRVAYALSKARKPKENYR